MDESETTEHFEKLRALVRSVHDAESEVERLKDELREAKSFAVDRRSVLGRFLADATADEPPLFRK